MEAGSVTTFNCIGAGRWGPNLIRSILNLPGADVHYACDLSPERLAVVAQRVPGIETTTDIDRAIEDPSADAIIIATPVYTHYELALKALRAGKDVLVEKPICRSLSRCEELINLAETKGLILAVGHVFLFNAGIRKVREYIASGELGAIQHIHAVRTNLGPVREDVNALWDLASHDLSVFDYWLDATPESVIATGQQCLGKEVEDVVLANFRYPKNVLASTYVSWLNPRKVREITVVGDKKMAVWNDMDVLEPVRLYDKSIGLEDHTEYADTLGAFQATIRDGDVLIPKVASSEPLREQCAHFLDCVRTRRTPINNARAAMDVVRSLVAADASMADHGKAVQVDPTHRVLSLV